ncbi:MAG TPA: hypothetical protein VGA94_03735 [Thermodesulfobacteriota bacterium]|jgi:hypothetical protein
MANEIDKSWNKFIDDTRRKVNDVLTGIESHSKMPFTRPNPDTWIVDLPSTRVHIKRNGPYITNSSELMDDVEGPNEGIFYKELLQTSGSMNRLHVGVENNKITLNSERSADEINPKNMVEDFILHHKGRQLLFKPAVRRAHELGLQWRQKEDEEPSGLSRLIQQNRRQLP